MNVTPNYATYAYKVEIDSNSAGEETLLFNPITKSLTVNGKPVSVADVDGKAVFAYQDVFKGQTLSKGTITFSDKGDIAYLNGSIYKAALPIDIDNDTGFNTSQNGPHIPIKSTLHGTAQ